MRKRDADDEPNLTSLLAESMDLRPGDVFTWEDDNGRKHVHQVEDIDDRHNPADRDSLTVSDPTVSNPQDARYGTWGVPLMDLFNDWLRYRVAPGRLEVATDE